MLKHSQGFTLVELSIVLVILGLLVGGVLTGQSLVRAAQLRAVTSEVTAYKTALSTFRDKYFSLPGDMSNAVRFWGAQAGATTDGLDSTCASLTIPAMGQATCNGNGDGYIAFQVVAKYEALRAWQHLANAGLIAGKYTGVDDGAYGSGDWPMAGRNVPASRYRSSSAGWVFVNSSRSGTATTAIRAFDAEYIVATTPGKEGLTLLFAGYNDNGGSSVLDVGRGVLTTEDAWNIDTKMDDGVPVGGLVSAGGGIDTGGGDLGDNGGGGICLDGSTNKYILTNKTIVCTMIFFTGY